MADWTLQKKKISNFKAVEMIQNKTQRFKIAGEKEGTEHQGAMGRHQDFQWERARDSQGA
jgi:hypothetical protein